MFVVLVHYCFIYFVAMFAVIFAGEEVEIWAVHLDRSGTGTAFQEDLQ